MESFSNHLRDYLTTGDAAQHRRSAKSYSQAFTISVGVSDTRLEAAVILRPIWPGGKTGRPRSSCYLKWSPWETIS